MSTILAIARQVFETGATPETSEPGPLRVTREEMMQLFGPDFRQFNRR